MLHTNPITLPSGHTIEIKPDHFIERPYRHTPYIRIVVLSSTYPDPSEGKCGTTPQQLADWIAANTGRWWTIPLYCHAHAGVAFRPGHINPFACDWDSGRIGIIAIDRTAIPADARLFTQLARCIADDFTAWINNDCHGFILRDSHGTEVNSAWGYFSTEHALADAQLAALQDLPPNA